MKEESLADDMRAALRGDRERADDARRRTLENVGALIEARPEREVAPPSEPKPSRLRSFFGRR